MGKVYHVMHLQLCKCTWYTRDVLCTWRVDCLVTLGAHFYDLPEPIYRPLMHWCYGKTSLNLLLLYLTTRTTLQHNSRPILHAGSADSAAWWRGGIECSGWALWSSLIFSTAPVVDSGQSYFAVSSSTTSRQRWWVHTVHWNPVDRIVLLIVINWIMLASLMAQHAQYLMGFCFAHLFYC